MDAVIKYENIFDNITTHYISKLDKNDYLTFLINWFLFVDNNSRVPNIHIYKKKHHHENYKSNSHHLNKQGLWGQKRLQVRSLFGWDAAVCQLTGAPGFPGTDRGGMLGLLPGGAGAAAGVGTGSGAAGASTAGAALGTGDVFSRFSASL